MPRCSDCGKHFGDTKKGCPCKSKKPAKKVVEDTKKSILESLNQDK